MESSELNDCAACARGISRSQMVNDPDRLTMPLLLDGEKGSGQFKEISWDEAFDLIEQKFKDAIATDGNKSICYVTGSGNFGAMHGPVANAFFGHLGGASTTVGSLCCAGTTAAIVPIYGKRFLDCRNQIENSTYVVVWGNNPAISKQGYFQRFEHVVENGGKLVVIDPIYTESPTIREMYMFPPQNPDLRPERLMNYEFSVTQSFWQRKLSLSANVYYLKGDNTIQAVFDGNRPINVNTGRIENYGVELTARYRAVRSLAFSGNYSWLHMEYKILAAPQHKLYAGIDFIRPRWSVSTGVQYIRGLYTDLKAPGTEQFVLWNLRASWQASSVVELFARGENLLAQDYEINAGYPMPRATVFGGVNLRF